MDAFTSTELGSLPPDWRVQRFDSLFAVQQGKQVSKKNRVGENQRPFLRTKNVFWGRLDLVDLDEMHFTEAEEKRLALEPGDLLVCEGGDIGRTAIWQGELDRCYYQNHLHRARLRDEAGDSRFALYWLWYAFEVGSVYFGRGNVTTIPNLSQSKLCELPLPVPPLPEQWKIAGVLGVVQRAIEQQERLLQLTAELKKTLLHQCFTHDFSNEREISVPEALQKFKILRDRQLPSAQIKEEGRFPVVDQGQAFISGYTDDASKVVDTGLPVVIFGDHTRCVKYVDFPFVLGADGTKVLKVDEAKFRPRFFYYGLSALDIPNRGYNRHFIILKEKRIKRPDFNVQDAVVEQFETFDRKIESIVRKRALLEDLFRTLLYQLMTAQIRVNKLNPDAPQIRSQQGA